MPSESHGDHYYGAVDELCSSPYPPPPPNTEPSFDRLQIKSQIGLEILISDETEFFPFLCFTTLNDCVDSRFREFLILGFIGHTKNVLDGKFISHGTLREFSILFDTYCC